MHSDRAELLDAAPEGTAMADQDLADVEPVEFVATAVAHEPAVLDDRKRARAAVFVGLMVLVANGLNAVFHFVVAHLMQPVEYSLLATLFLIVTISAVPALSLQAVVAKDVLARIGEHGHAAVGLVLREVLAWFWPRVLVLLAIGTALAIPLAVLTHVQRALPALAAAVAVIAGLLSPIVWGALQGVERFTWFGLSQAAFAGAKFVVGIALAAAGYGAAAILFGVAAASVLAAGLSLWPLRDMLRASRGMKAAKLKFVSRYLPEASLALSLFVALSGMDLIVSRIAFTDGTSGAYAAASVGARTLLVIPMAATTVLFPRIAAMNDSRGERRYLLLGAAAVGAIGAVCAAVVLIFPSPLLHLAFGHKYDMAQSWIGPLSISMVFYGIGNVYLFHFLAQGRGRFMFVLTGVLLAQLTGFALFHGRPIDLVYVQIVTSVVVVIACEAFDRIGVRSRQAAVARPA
jgi:O-antigen/teichoic acid export membrane protein